MARDWERANERSFFFGGEGKAAVDCAWAQALAAEHAKAIGWEAAAQNISNTIKPFLTTATNGGDPRPIKGLASQSDSPDILDKDKSVAP